MAMGKIILASKATRRHFKRRPKRGIRRTIRRYSKSSNVSIPRSLWPNRRIVTLTYSQNVSINPGVSGTLATHRFACNGLYKPDITTTGHQPLGYDQLKVFYAKQTVLKSTIIATFSATSSTTTGYMLGIWRNPTNTTITSSYTNLQENGGAVMRPFAFNSATECPKIKFTFDTKRHMSVKDPLDEPNLASDAGKNPPTLATYDVFAQPLDAATDQPTVNVNVVIQYTAICTGPIPTVSS